MNKLAGSLIWLLLPLATAATAQTGTQQPWLKNYQPNAQSRKFPVGSSQERRARMAGVAHAAAYTRQFDLSGLPAYAPKSRPTGTLRVCGNNYLGDSPLGDWWQEAFGKIQPGIHIKYDLQTAADAIACLYLNAADIGMDHQPGFYDDLSHLRLKGYLPTGLSVVTGSLDVLGWQNTLAIIVNSHNPISQLTMQQLDGIFGAQRAGGWLRTTWHPEFARGPEGDIRTWGQLGLAGEWANRPIDTYGFSERYATATEFSDKVLSSSDKWNGNYIGVGNYIRPDGTTYVESDQIIDRVKNDPNGIGYTRFHQGLPDGVKVLALARTAQGPFVPLTLETEQDRSYPLWGDQQFWVSAKPGTPLDPKIYEFIRFVLSRDGQALVQRDGKYLPLTAAAAAEQMRRLDALAAGKPAN